MFDQITLPIFLHVILIIKHEIVINFVSS